MIELHARNVDISINKAVLLNDVSISLRPGELVALLGPNGAGKSTLLKAALGLVKVNAGEITLGGDKVDKLTPVTRAQRIAYLPQLRPLAWPNTVIDIVALGRYAYGGNLGRLSTLDAAAVDQAIEQCGISHIAKRKANTLSGGELARVHCARAFAARAPLLIADEPVAALDPQHQYRIMDIIKRYVAEGNGAMVVLHDMPLAAQYADRMIWMSNGTIEADGSPEETLTEQRLADVFGITAQVNGRQVSITGAN